MPIMVLTKRERQKAGIYAAVAVALLIIILVTLSFNGVDYYNYGFPKQLSTGAIDTSKVYYSGRHFMGPDYTFKEYPATAQMITLKQTPIYSKEKLEIKIDITFQYFLRPEQLLWLHQDYELQYESVIRTRAISALKDGATVFNTDQFFRDRAVVEKHLFKSLRDRLGGACCEKDCELDKCLPSCMPYSSCSKASSGMFVNVRYFVMGNTLMPKTVYDRYLQALLLEEKTATSLLQQQEVVVKAEIYEAVRLIDNQANEVARNATADSALVASTSSAEGRLLSENARSAGLRKFMSALGFTTASEKLSFHYLSELEGMSNAHLTVAYDSFIMGPKSP